MQSLTCPDCGTQVEIPSWMIGKPEVYMEFVESAEEKHEGCTAEGGRRDYLFRMAVRRELAKIERATHAAALVAP